MKIADNRTEST